MLGTVPWFCLRAAWKCGSSVIPIFQLRKQRQRPKPKPHSFIPRPTVCRYWEISHDNSSRRNSSGLSLSDFKSLLGVEVGSPGSGASLAQELNGGVLLAFTSLCFHWPFSGGEGSKRMIIVNTSEGCSENSRHYSCKSLKRCLTQRQ